MKQNWNFYPKRKVLFEINTAIFQITNHEKMLHLEPHAAFKLNCHKIDSNNDERTRTHA